MTSQKLKAIIIDSSVGNRIKLEDLLGDFCEDVQLLGSSPDLKHAEDLLSGRKVDLAFILSEFGIEQISDFYKENELSAMELVFLCSKDHHYIEVFERLSIEYLTQPVTISKLIKVVKNSKNLLTQRKGVFSFEQAIKQVNKTDLDLHEVILPIEKEFIKVVINTILYCGYDGSRTHFNLLDGSHLVVLENIRSYEDLLVDYGFIRTHNSTLVNLKFVTEVDRSQVTIKGGKKLPLSKVRRTEVESRFKTK